MMILLNNTDITSLVDITSITTNDTLDESLASGSMIIPLSTQNTPYARFSEVNIDGLLYVVAEDVVKLVKKTTPKLYRHEITLIEPTKILQKRVIPNITVTQPQGDYTQYVFSIYKATNVSVDNTLQTLSLSLSSPPQDTSIINGLTLKNLNEYEIYSNFTLRNEQFNNVFLKHSDAEVTIEFSILYAGTVIDTKEFTVNGTTLFGDDIIYRGGFLTKYTPPFINGNLSVKVRTLGTYTIDAVDLQDELTIDEYYIKPSQKANISNDKIKLDAVVDKILSFHPTFTLADSTRQRIAEYTSPEFTFQNLTLYDALKEVANYVSAIVYLGEDDFTTIYFYFYDNPIGETLDIVDIEQVEYLDDYADGLEINAANVIREHNDLYTIYEPSDTDWLTVRGATDERGIQIIDNQTAIHLQLPIYRLNEVKVRGIAFTMYEDGTAKTGAVNFTTTQVWDITNYVIEQQRYNTFDTQAQTSVNIRGSFKNKSNTMYYTQGQNKIQGLGFQGAKPPVWLATQPPNFAIIEAILNKAAEENPSLEFENEYLLSTDIHDLQFRIGYLPYSDVRLTVYKQQGDNIMYFNERDSLNDMELLGKVAQENATRTGNRVQRYQGLTYSDRLLLGSQIEGDTLVNYTISRTPTINKFTAEYAKGYANISNYVGIDSRYRQFEVPTDTIVNRRDKLTTFLSLNISNTTPSTTLPSYMTNQIYSGIWGNLFNTPSGRRPQYAKLIFDTQDGVKTVESIVDAYRMGKTLGLAVDMLDNYSAGIKKVEKEFYNIGDVKVQEDAIYTDTFGKVDSVNIEYYSFGGVDTVIEGDTYPNNNLSPSTVYKVFDYTYNVNKDPRERFGFVWELAFLDGTLKVYDGFVKYNLLGSNKTTNLVEFRLLNKGYIPTRDLDINKTFKVTGSITHIPTIPYATLNVDAHLDGEYEGLVLTINQEPILVWQTDLLDTGVALSRYIYTEAV
jgi:hypothetical protein